VGQIKRIIINPLSGEVAYAVYILLSAAEHCSHLTVVGHSCGSLVIGCSVKIERLLRRH
jgi:hypothetical protein